MTPEFQAKMLCHRLRMTKTGGFAMLLAKDDPKLRAAFKASNEAVDIVIAYWQKLIDAKDEPRLKAALERHYAAERESEEDDIIAHAESIKAERLAKEKK